MPIKQVNETFYIVEINGKIQHKLFNEKTEALKYIKRFSFDMSYRLIECQQVKTLKERKAKIISDLDVAERLIGK